MATTATNTRWLLEIAKGREPGRRYSLDHGETTLGNAPWAASYLSLADQEGDSPRRMASKQALLILAADRFAIRDLDSPGGTFVNRQRLFTNQERSLAPGDVIQVGAVQLVVRTEQAQARRPEPEAPARSANGPAKPTPVPKPVPAAPKPRGPSASAAPAQPPSPPRTGPLSVPYAFKDGSTCRTWDDFLTVSAQRWEAVRDEVASGRVGEHLRQAGRGDLLPRREPGWTPDDVLDDWLGRLPTSKPSGPELDVHPESISIPAGAAGGVSRRSIRIANVGYRILRPTIAVENAVGMPGAIRLAAGASDRVLAVVDEAELTLEIEPPDGAYDVTLGAVVVNAGGVTRRIGIRVERARVDPVPEGPDLEASTAWSPVRPLGDRLAGLSVARRLWAFPLVVLALRGLIALGNRIPYLADGGELKLAGSAALPTFVGAVLGWAVGMSSGFRDSIASTFAGGVVGLLASSLIFATVRSIEPVFGNPALAAMALGFGLAAASYLAFPPTRKEEQV